jgi:DNA-binding MarR family transcriptional regulator
MTPPRRASIRDILCSCQLQTHAARRIIRRRPGAVLLARQDYAVDTEPTVSANEVARVAELRAALRRYLHRSERIARTSGLTPQRHLLLLMIKGAPDGSERSTVTELAERLQLAQSTVTELVGRAEAAGLIERRRSPQDGRVVEVRLAPEGERRLARSFTGHAEERERLIEALGRFGFADG